MKEMYISMFIDDELNLDEKVEFVEIIHDDREFKDETLDFLKQEKALRLEPVAGVPQLNVLCPRRRVAHLLRPMGLVAAGLAFALVISAYALFFGTDENSAANYRFLLYRPGIQELEIAGTFTNWQRIPLHQVDKTGYWEIFLDVGEGEHRFAYIIDGEHRIADPTTPMRETDDFGGENSILVLGDNA